MDTLYLATDDPTDVQALEACAEHVHGCVRLMVAASDDIDRVLTRHFGQPASQPPEKTTSKPTDAVVATAAMVPLPAPPPKPRLSDAVELGWDDFELVAEPDGISREPSILLVQAEDEFALQCSRAAKKLDVKLKRCGVSEAATAAAEHRPFIILVTEEVYGFDRVAFTKLAIKISAHLVIWSEDIDAEYLEPILVAARKQGLG